MRVDVTDELPLPAVVGLGQRVVVGTATLPEGTVLLLVLRIDVWGDTRRPRADVRLTAALDIVAVLDPTPWRHAGEAWAAATGDWFFYEPYAPDELHGAVIDWHEDPADIVTLLRDRDHVDLARELEAEAHGKLAVEEIVHAGSDGVHEVVEIALRDVEPRLDPDIGGRGRFVQRRFSLKVCPGCGAPDEHIGRHIVGRTTDEIRTKVTALLHELDGTPRRLWDDELRARFDVVAHGRWSTLGWYGPARRSDRHVYVDAVRHDGPTFGPVTVGAGTAEPGDVMLQGGLVLRTDPATGVVRGAWLPRRPWRRYRAESLSGLETEGWTAIVRQAAGRARRRQPAARWRDSWVAGRPHNGRSVRIGEDLVLAVGMSGAVAGWMIDRDDDARRRVVRGRASGGASGR